MANDIAANPIIIDTAGASALTAFTFIATKIRWVSGTTAGHQAIVQNGNSIVKFKAEATGANYTESEHFDPPLIFDGLIVPTLGSGTIYIYVASAIPIKS